VPGLFVTFEGIDRSGKSTQARMLVEALGEDALPVREPGGTGLGERMRELLKDPSIELDPHTEALLFAAARAELCAEVIRPALEAGRIVVSDRFVDSSIAYQGEARGLGVDEIARLNTWATDGLVPHVTLYLAIEPEQAGARGGEDDRFEEDELQRRVHAAYERLAAEDPARWRRIPADRPPEEVHADVLAAVQAARAGAPA
jgi:dTMP kinase